MPSSFIFVIGGVLSGLGKGITTASMGKLLQSRGFSVTAIKIDPYLNVDAGTLRPTEHGEVWVTEDGGEIDQDLGNYERFLDVNIPKCQNITTGQIYEMVIKRERKGEYLGKTVEMIPHVTDEVKRRIRKVADDTKVNVVLVEIGGTVGEYQNIIYFEAARQMKLDGDNVLFVHVSYLPILRNVGEQKTKPVQTSTRQLLEIGIQPDFIIGRSEVRVDNVRKEKIAMFCNVKKEDVISNHDVDCIYEVPLVLEEQNMGDRMLEKLGLKARKNDMTEWREFVRKVKGLEKKLKVGIVGKYFDIGDFNLQDSYISVIEAVKHACFNNNVKSDILWIDSKEFEDSSQRLSFLDDVDCLIVPGGFGKSGIEGKILSIKYAREKKIPFLGLCLGMQLAVIEFARNICNLNGADSTEFNPDTEYPVIDFIPEQASIIKDSRYGGTMRLGSYPALLKEGTIVKSLYGSENIFERHRHRYEVNPDYIEALEKNGLVFSGISPNGILMEFLELENHPFFVATQSHPEFKSRPTKPSPMFDGLVKAALKKKKVGQA
ncbi:MAG: CTP synthase [Candidatus Aenigmatarchaeota archaeon]